MTKVGFLVNVIKPDPKWSKKQLVKRFRYLSILPAGFIHEFVMPRIPVDKLRMGTALNIQSKETGAKTEMVYWGESRDPNQMMRDKRVDRLIQAASCCAEEGAKLVGLGAYTAIIGNHGHDIAKVLGRRGVGITTGNSLTAATGVEGLLNLARLVGYDPSECTAAVIGAGGSVGRVAAQLLAQSVRHVYVAGRNDASLDDLVLQIGSGKASQVRRDEALMRALLIITVTSDSGTLTFDPRILRPGAIICDIARPRDIAHNVAGRPDVLVFDGAILQIPGSDYRCNFDYGFPPSLTFACMAETMILGLENRTDNFSLGKNLDLDKVKEIAQLAKFHGFTIAGYRSFDRAISSTQIEAFTEFAQHIPLEVLYG